MYSVRNFLSEEGLLPPGEGDVLLFYVLLSLPKRSVEVHSIRC